MDDERVAVLLSVDLMGFLLKTDHGLEPAMVCACLCQVPADLSTFNENPAWPVVLDDFVECAEHLKRKDV